MKIFQDSTQRMRVLLSATVLGISLVHFSVKSRVVREVSWFDDLMIRFFGSTQHKVSSAYGSFSSFFKHYVFNINASKENIELKKKIKKLENEIFSYSEIDVENTRLRKLLKYEDFPSYKKVVGQVVSWDSSGDMRVIRINKGHKHGISLQAPVVTSDGLVGYIYRLTRSYADVLTVLDINNRVDSLVQRVRAHGIVEGKSRDRGIMKYVKNSRPLILNDVVITSGLGNIYPKGLKVGVVSKIERESHGITQNVEILPSVNFSELEEVVVLVDRKIDQKKRELRSLNKLSEGDSK